MLLGAAAEGAAPDVVPQLLDQLWVLLLDLLRKLLPPEKKKKKNMLPVQQCATNFMLKCVLIQGLIIIFAELFTFCVWFLTVPVCLLCG